MEETGRSRGITPIIIIFYPLGKSKSHRMGEKGAAEAVDKKKSSVILMSAEAPGSPEGDIAREERA